MTEPWRKTADELPLADETVLGHFREDWGRCIPGGPMLMVYKSDGTWVDQYDDNDSHAPDFWQRLTVPESASREV